MTVAISDEAVANAKRLYAEHVRGADGACRCGQSYEAGCQQQRSYAVNTLRLAGFQIEAEVGA